MKITSMTIAALCAVFLTGCKCENCVDDCEDPIVHPTDDQIKRATPGGASKEPAYVPWWAE